MPDNDDNDVPAALDLARLYANYLKSCATSGVASVSRERALGLVQEWARCCRVVRSRQHTRG